MLSPTVERAQDSADAADGLVLFAKLYDLAPDGTRTLVHRLVAGAAGGAGLSRRVTRPAHAPLREAALAARSGRGAIMLGV